MRHSLFEEMFAKTTVALALITVSMYVGTTLPNAAAQNHILPEEANAKVITEKNDSQNLQRRPLEEIKTYSVPLTTDTQLHLQKTAQAHGIRPELVLSIIDIESSFDPNAESHTDDHGLMQINGINHDRLAKIYGITDFYNPEQNITAGIHILNECLEHFNGDETSALIAYQRGIRGAEMLLDQGYRDTAYSQKVQAREAKGFDSVTKYIYADHTENGSSSDGQ